MSVRTEPSRLGCLALALVALAGCSRGPDDEPAAPAPPTPSEPTIAAPVPARADDDVAAIHLTDVTSASGIDMIMRCGVEPSREILDVDGGGLALLDYDNDGDLDLFVANGATRDDPENGPGSRLFRNDGALTFTDVTEAAGIDLRRWAMGAAAGDVDGDGHDDLYVACYGPNVLLRNRGDGRFEDVSAAAGVDDDRWGTSVAFGDLDGDGDLDLYVVNYLEFDIAHPPPRARHKGQEVMNGPHNLPPQADLVYENDGDGTFRDVTAAAGFGDVAPSFGLNAVVLDVDGDHRQDVIVGNDSMANFLFRNTTDPGGPMRFEDVGAMSGIASNVDGSNQATMGLAVGDVDGNGFPDVFSTNFANDTNTLHLNVDGRFFDDRTRQFGLALVSRPTLGWGCAFVDLDHSAREDLIIFNGHVYPEATLETMDSAYEQPPLLFRRGPRRFERVDAESAGAWLARPGRDRTLVLADLDGDGDVDAVVGELNGPVRVLRNDHPPADDWLIVRLRDEREGAPNPRGIGARVEVVAGETRQRRWLVGGGPFQSSAPPEAHFGRGRTPGPVTVEVTWPDGTVQREAGVAWGSALVVRRGD